MEIDEECGLRGQGNVRYYKAHNISKKPLYLVYIIIFNIRKYYYPYLIDEEVEVFRDLFPQSDTVSR